MSTTRRDFIVTGAVAAGMFWSSAQVLAGPARFSFATVRQRALALSKRPHDATPDPLPDALSGLDYTRFRDISFRTDHALWQGGGLFRIQCFHRGFIYRRRVDLHLVEDGVAHEVAYSPQMFDFGKNKLDANFPADLGFSGFRLHFPFSDPKVFDEFAVFQGASYFRLRGSGQEYGLSARGLALNTAEPEGEEFPEFTAFWIERPAAGAAGITVYALLESPSVTGAYRFVLTPGSRTTAVIEAELFPRVDIKKTGFGALTSMYLHGKPLSRVFADARPEVHDSDGLLLHTGSGEWLWRPLLNTRGLRVSSFSDDHPRGFGLLQRERDLRAYEDMGAREEVRPNYYLTPKGNWGPGHVELVEIPTDGEWNDNMVAYWVSGSPLRAGVPASIAYTIAAYLDDPGLPATGRVLSTRLGPPAPVPLDKADPKGAQRFFVDFGAGEIAGLGANAPVEINVTCDRGAIKDVIGQRNGPDRWRAMFTFVAQGDQETNLRAYLSLHGRPLTETWLYRWTAEAY